MEQSAVKTVWYFLTCICWCMLSLGACEHVSLSSTVYCVILATYVNCLVYVVGILSCKQSFWWFVHVEPLVFQCVHGHVSAICLTHIHLHHRRAALLLSTMIIMQQHATQIHHLQKGVYRTVFVGNMQWATRCGTLFVFAFMYHCIESECSHELQCSGETKCKPDSLLEWAQENFERHVFTYEYPAIVFVFPKMVFLIASSVAMGCQQVCVK